MINNNRRNNSKLAQFKAAVAHLPFTQFKEDSDSIAASYITKGSMTNPSITIEVGYNPNLLGTSCKLTVYRNEVQTDNYGTYDIDDIDEFVEQLEPYFNLGDEVSLVKQLDRRLTKLEMIFNDNNHITQEVSDQFSLLLQEEYERGFADGLNGYPSNGIKLGSLVSGAAIGTNSKYKGKLGKLPGTNRNKIDTFHVEVDELKDRKIDSLFKRKPLM